MTEQQIQRFERAVAEFVRAAERLAPRVNDASQVQRAVREDQADEWKRDISQIRQDVNTILGVLSDREGD